MTQELHLEEVVLGGLIMALPDKTAATALVAKDFALIHHRIIFEALLDEGVKDWMLLCLRLQALGQLDDVGGYAGVAKIQQEGIGAVSANLHYYVDALLKEAAKREIGSIAHKLLQDSQNPSPDLDLGLMTSKAAQDMRAASDRSGANMWLDSGQVLLDVANGDMPVKILDFHFPALPMLMSDRKPLAGHLWIVAGAFKSGKTTLALNLLCGMLEAGHQVGVVSLEMTPAEYSLAALAIMTDTPLQLDSLTDEHRAIIANFAQTDGRTFKVRQIGKNNWAGIEAAIRKLHSDAITAGRPLSVVLVDHLGLAQSDDPRLNELQAKKEIADACKRVAMELGILVILLAQMNKEGVRSSNPDASHITGLVGIPAVANVVLGINIPDGWEADDKPMFRVATLAHRNGPAGRYATYHRTEAGKMILVGEFPY